MKRTFSLNDIEVSDSTDFNLKDNKKTCFNNEPYTKENEQNTDDIEYYSDCDDECNSEGDINEQQSDCEDKCNSEGDINEQQSDCDDECNSEGDIYNDECNNEDCDDECNSEGDIYNDECNNEDCWFKVKIEIPEEISFYPDEIEQEIIKNALSMISKSTKYDWKSDKINEDKMMILNKVEYLSLDDEFPTIIILDLRKNDNRTCCKITTNRNDDKRDIYLYWYSESNTKYNNNLVVAKYVSDRFLYFFTRSSKPKMFSILIDGKIDWCDFRLARNHLEKISN